MKGIISALYGIPVRVVDEKLLTWPVQYRFPRSKKKRIQKKWKKDKANYKPKQHVIMVKGGMWLTQEALEVTLKSTPPTPHSRAVLGE
jgi:hypothetical protein